MEITYTHDEGVVIKVSRLNQRVIIGDVTLGPFQPYDLTSTMDAICAHARDTARPSLMRAAEDWQAVNTDDDAIVTEESAHKRERNHGWRWESPNTVKEWCA